jgi:hypothetical protein
MLHAFLHVRRPVMNRYLPALALCIAASAAPAHAGNAPAAATASAPAAATAVAPPVSKAAQEDAFTLVQFLVEPQLSSIGTAITDSYMKALKQRHPDLSLDTSEAVQQRVQKIAGDPATMKDMEAALVPVFTRSYDDEELRQILAFAKTSAGKKLLTSHWPPASMNGALSAWVNGTLSPRLSQASADILQKAGISP